MNVTTITAQSLFDIAIQTGGHVETAFSLSIDNDRSLTGEIVAGTALRVRNIQNRPIVDYYRAKNIKPATYSGRDVLGLTGIGVMIIEENFIVG